MTAVGSRVCDKAGPQLRYESLQHAESFVTLDEVSTKPSLENEIWPNNLFGNSYRKTYKQVALMNLSLYSSEFTQWVYVLTDYVVVFF